MLASEKANAEGMIRRLKQEGHPYGTTEAEYIRFLKNNVKPMNIKGAYITLARIFDIFIPAPFDLDFLKNGHTYIVGRSGSGKSELIRSLCRRLAYNFVLLDPHGDLSNDLVNSYGNIAPPRFAPHEKRAVINPFDIDDKSPENRELVAQEITDLMAELVEDSGLSRLMTTIIFPIVYTLLALPYADFKMLSDCINPNAGKARLKSISHLVEPHHKAIWRELEGDTYDTSKQSVFNRLQSLLNYRLVMQTLCGKDDFSRAIEPRLHEGKGVIVSLPIPVIGEAVAITIGRFFMTRMQIWAKRRQSIPEHNRAPVVFFVDEFHNFVSHATAKTLDQYGRKFKLYMVLAHQHIQQITDREIRGSVLANTVNKIAGISNTETRQAIAREMAIEPDQLESLNPGHFLGRFGSSEAFPFYARRARKSEPIKTPFIESVNGAELVDGWEGFDQEQDGHETARPKPGQRKVYKPKFDI
jgi:DNA helicase HerA-like ATPase